MANLKETGRICLNTLEKIVIPLLEWYRDNARDLPWRRTQDPYAILLSEVMLQQTRVAAVIGYYHRFLEAAPTPQALAQLEEDALMKLWQGLGYYSRARNLQKAAQDITHQRGGVFPSTYRELLTLSGVGEYTAGAVASIAFGEPVAAVDGNVLRVVTRLTADDSDITRPDTRRAIAAKLEAVMPLEAPGRFNQALMELGATVCLPNGAPLCDRCPLEGQCEARIREDFSFPKKPPKKARKKEERPVCLLFREGKVALRRRPPRGLLAGLYEYPDQWGEVAHGEPEWVGEATHIFTHKEWHMTAWAAEAQEEALPEGWFWADWTDWKHTYSIPSAFAPFAPCVEGRLQGPSGSLW